ncbi:regulator of hemoglobinization and erythroid cell expansion protein [Aptenodytes patagonicus]|uniref:regulator of hemoglobinization and erythroid cell expansion protein n=1 Tax=Aptenodytes patagonicus TaxID=9234 RepID=UPI003F9FEDD9
MSTCEWWVLVAISAVTLILYTLLLVTLYIMLSRKIASHSCGKQASSSPAAQPQQPPTSSAGGEGVQRPVYTGSSDTSSETSEDSDSSPSCPQGPCSEENLNYTSLVFPGKARGPGSPGDYENMKTREDYVNVDPKKRNVDFWPCSSPVASKSIEYTEKTTPKVGSRILLIHRAAFASGCRYLPHLSSAQSPEKFHGKGKADGEK